jgi:uncharacterized protein YdiU (UPF0061 family)
MARHHPEAAGSDDPYLGLYEAVVEAQASLVAQWMLVGFVHGVMNTDNMTISGESIDFGPCAFMDTYDPAALFSSIDHGGRYAYGNQPRIAQWNLARLAEAMLELFDADTDTAVEKATGVLGTFPDRFHRYWAEGMRAKLGLSEERPGDDDLANELLELMHARQADFTSFFRGLSASLRGLPAPGGTPAVGEGAFGEWAVRWRDRLAAEGADPQAVAAAMDRVNPLYIPRNHRVERALEAAHAGDLGPFERLVDVLSRPFDEREGLGDYATAAPADFGPYTTFCGT